MKKFLAIVLSLVMVLSLVSLAAAEEYKKEVVIAYGAAPSIIDPQAFTLTVDYAWHWLSHDTLFKVNPETGDILYNLCVAYEQDAADPTWWTLKLREGVKFHNGNDFTAEDVAFTLFERGVNSNSTSAFCKTLAAYEIVDANTIKIQTVSVNADFLPRLANVTTGMLDKEAVTADPEKGYWYGTGAYEIAEFIENDHMTFNRFAGYWGEAPVTEKIVIRGITEASARLIALQNGEIDVCMDPSPLELDIVRDDANLDLIEAVGGMSYYLSFNTKLEREGDINFRKAIGYAIDDEAVMIICADGAASKSNTIYGPNYILNCDDALTGLPFDLAKAQEMIKAGGWEGQTVSILVSDSGYQNSMAKAIQPMLMAAGLNVDIVERGTAEVKTLRTSGEFEIMAGGFSCSDYPDSIRSSCYSTGAYNFAYFNEPEIDAKIDAGLTMSNWEDRVQNYKEIQQYVFDEMTYYYCVFRPDADIAMQKGVSGFYPRCDQINDYTYITAIAK